MLRIIEPVFRLAEKVRIVCGPASSDQISNSELYFVQEWKAFIEVLVPMVSDVDEQVPPLPPNDVIHRIYRDVSLQDCYIG